MKLQFFLMLFLLAVLPAASQSSFPGLLAKGSSPEEAHKMSLFGQFVGDWVFHGVEYRADGTKPTDDGEIQFRLVLDGRAVQDVWRETQRSDSDPLVHGTTFRFYDPKRDSWNTTWIEPRLGVVTRLEGKQVGEEIVLSGQSADGSPIRWIFSEIKPQSFHWRGEKLIDGSWRVYEEVRARRK